MAKMGVLHDYDLMANREEAAQKPMACVVCDAPRIMYQWSDYHGEAMCSQCGCPYQIKSGSDEQVKEGKYPYISLLDSFVPVAREYWQHAREFVHYGHSFSNDQGKAALVAWLKVHHPETLQRS